MTPRIVSTTSAFAFALASFAGVFIGIRLSENRGDPR
jgi:branched-subunit amino acid ABC-type transport system permease component